MHENDHRFDVRESTVPGAGRGLFARTALRRGDRLEAIGVLVRAGSLEDTCTAFADAYKLRAGDCLLIPCGYAALVNHADTPNLEKVVEEGRVFLQALRDIQPGEELFFRYSDYALERFGIRPRP